MIVICGPTATGKSDLAVSIALFIGKAEIISTDSRQVYTHLNLGTGKITQDEMRGVPHHMLDIVEPKETYTADNFTKKAKQIIQDIYSRGNTPILCGGTGLYIDTLVHDIQFPDVKINTKLRQELETKNTEELVTIFQSFNKNQPHAVDLKNKRKVIRAIEILKELGHIPPIEKKDIYDVLYIGLDGSDAALKEKIKKRIDKRLEDGMIEESERLLELGILTHDRMKELGLEYAYTSSYLQKHISLDEFKEKLFYAIWHYAKRQRTWFRRNKNIHWLDVSDIQLTDTAKNTVQDFI